MNPLSPANPLLQLFDSHAPEDLRLSWPLPAAHWNEAAPVGNGRLGAMVFGGTHRARIQINDSTVWSGTPAGPADALTGVLAGGAGPDRLAEVRAALGKHDHRTAESLLMTFQGRYSQEYLPYADLLMTLGSGREQAVHHGRTLDLDDGVVQEDLDLDGRRIRRLTWASAPAGALCVALAVDGGRVDLRLALDSPLRVVHTGYSADGAVLGVEIPVDGAPSHETSVAEPLRWADGPVDGYDPYGAVALRVATDGRVTADDDGWAVQGMSYALLTLASSTSAADHWSGRGPRSRTEHREAAAATAAAALARGAETLLREHRADLRDLLGAGALEIGPRRAGTFDVVRDVLGGGDELLTATVLFQLGRYLLASASRPGAGPPANLQGIWNADLRPAWSSNYTVNINTQMNYWGAEAAGLGACHEPLFDLLDRLARTGAPVARELYGARGWVAHHNTDPWGWALPVGGGHGDPSWSMWQMGGVWLSQHLWDHYEFTLDQEFLRDRGWPVLRGAALFCLDWLVEDGDGGLGTVPSTSPENLFRSPEGRPESLTRSSAMDTALIRALFERSLRAAAVLGLDDPVTAEIGAALPRLPRPQVTAGGWLQEWADDLPEVDPAHRHLSQMIAVHPLDQIDPDRTPELAAAALRLLDRRGPGAMGWSWSWKIALRARLRDAATARELLLEATRPFPGDPDQPGPVTGREWGGLLPNLFSTHPPFQMDGNYGLMAAVVEMLVQSQGGVIRVLPALPEQWPDGACRGIRCRGGLAVDLAWSDGRLAALTVRRLHGDDGPVQLEYQGRRSQIQMPRGSSVDLGADLEVLC